MVTYDTRRTRSGRTVHWRPDTLADASLASRDYLIVNALNTYVAPNVNPTDGSRDVIPRMIPASARTVPRVRRPPRRIAPRLSVPGGGVPLRVLQRPLISPTSSTPSFTARATDAP